MQSMRFICVFSILFLPIFSRSLSEVICGQNGENCPSKSVHLERFPEAKIRSKPQGRDLTSPSFNELYRWENYETMEQGTGLQPDAGGRGVNGLPYGPGLGDVEIRTGLGVNYGIGDLGIRRDFGLFMGGSGRSGGQAFGWGNGYQRRTGAAPWFWP